MPSGAAPLLVSASVSYARAGLLAAFVSTAVLSACGGVWGKRVVPYGLAAAGLADGKAVVVAVGARAQCCCGSTSAARLLVLQAGPDGWRSLGAWDSEEPQPLAVAARAGASPVVASCGGVLQVPDRRRDEPFGDGLVATARGYVMPSGGGVVAYAEDGTVAWSAPVPAGDAVWGPVATVASAGGELVAAARTSRVSVDEGGVASWVTRVLVLRSDGLPTRAALAWRWVSQTPGHTSRAPVTACALQDAGAGLIAMDDGFGVVHLVVQENDGTARAVADLRDNGAQLGAIAAAGSGGWAVMTTRAQTESTCGPPLNLSESKSTVTLLNSDGSVTGALKDLATVGPPVLVTDPGGILVVWLDPARMTCLSFAAIGPTGARLREGCQDLNGLLPDPTNTCG